MSAGDFLHKDAKTPLCEYYTAAGATCRLTTNSESLLQAARESFVQIEPPSDAPDFSLRFWIDDRDPTQPPWPKPYVRGLSHLVFVGLNPRSSMLANLSSRHVIGRFSAALGADTAYWRMIAFPILLSVLSGSVRLVELHGSCVARGRRGLILVGPSRSGKSTLALALAQVGFRLLSDDRTFCSWKNGRLVASGLSRPIKLRREAAQWFEELHGREPNDVQNGERVFHCDPNRWNGMQPNPDCEPALILFLEREEGSRFEMGPMNRNEARLCLEQDLLAEAPDALQIQSDILMRLLSLDCRRLRYGGRPQEIAERITASFAMNSDCQFEGATPFLT